MTSQLVNPYLPEVSEETGLLLDWLKQLNSRYAHNFDSYVGCVSHMAYICLLRHWTRPVGDDTFELVEIDPYWHADVDWFGDGFSSKLRQKENLVYITGGERAEMQALAHFSRHMVAKFEKLYLSLTLWLSTTNDMALNIGLLEPFYVVRDYVSFPNFDQREVALGDLCYTAQTLDHLSEIPNQKEWERDLTAGGDVITTMGGVLTHFECRHQRRLVPG